MFRGSWRQNRALMMGIPSERARAYSTDSSDSPMMIPGLRAQYSLKREGSSTFRVKQATPSLSPKTDLVWDSKCRDICSVPVTHDVDPVGDVLGSVVEHTGRNGGVQPGNILGAALVIGDIPDVADAHILQRPDRLLRVELGLIDDQDLLARRQEEELIDVSGLMEAKSGVDDGDSL